MPTAKRGHGGGNKSRGSGKRRGFFAINDHGKAFHVIMSAKLTTRGQIPGRKPL
jgi:hypothetical protein